MLHLELAESVGADRFLREIRLTSQLDHPSIVPVMDSGADGSQLYCVLPYMEGGTLRDLLRTSRQLAITEAVRIATTIAEALTYAHANGLIHRDIKPENILFDHGKPYLGDFGIARVLHATAGDLATTTTGVVRGTPAYMSPEQASGERNYDARSDLYSLGCVVYEMISGMPPFVGPTAQSVLAQRFSVTPRPMRTYRKTVSEELERVVEKAMALMPADRYATAKEFSDAIEAAARAPLRQAIRQSHVAVGAIAAALLVGVGIFAGQQDVFDRAEIRPDTTQLAVLPFERDANTDTLGAVDAFVYDAFSAWRGLTVLEPFQVRDAVARQASVSGVERDRAVALGLGAGRFVRGSVTSLPDGSGWRVGASLHQVEDQGDSTLVSYRITIRKSDLASIGQHYAVLAQKLLVRGSDTADVSPVVGTTSLPAMQSFAKGIAAVNEWDFPTADSLFQQAISLDPDYRRAYLWQAQVRFWQRSPPDQWTPLAQKALVDTTRMPTRDLELARALAALGAQQYEVACAEYEKLRDKNQADFAAWFGLARCRDLDFRIVRDVKSPTRWRYVSSYHDAVQAYQKAFDVLSLSHRSLERGAFEPLRELLFMRPGRLQAATPPPEIKELYVGRLDWEDGKPILRPMPYALVSAGDPAAVPAGMRTAIESQQRLFGTIAASWSTALPNSAGAKEAVAVALEMRGDRAALDTLRAAQARASEADARLRLAVAEVFLRTKFAEPSDSPEVLRIRSMADSLLGAYPHPRRREAGYLTALAALLGRCDRAEALSKQAPVAAARGVARDVIDAADALTVTTMLGCGSDAAAEIRRLKSRIESASGSDPGAVNGLLLRAVLATEGRDTALTSLFAGSNLYLLRAQRAAGQRKSDSVRAIMTRLNAARLRTGYDDIGPDATYLEARVMLDIGDTASAVVALDRAFERLPFSSPGMLNRPTEMAGLMRAMQLRGEIAAAQRDTGRAAAWGKMKQMLWQPGTNRRTSSSNSR